MNLTEEKLKYFICVAEIQHVGRASKHLSISPSVISSTISSFEEELGCNLFDRIGNRIKINEHGERLLTEAKSILSLISEIPYKVREDANISGKLKISGSSYLMDNIGLNLILDFINKYPDVDAEVNSVDTGIVIEDVLSKKIDLGIVFNPVKHESLNEYTLREGQFFLCVRKGHPVLKIKQKAQQLLGLNQYNSIAYKTSTGSNYYIDHPIFSKYGLKTNHTFFYNNEYLAVKYLENTDSWGFLPDFVIQENKDVLAAIVPKGWKAEMKVSIVVNKSDERRIPKQFIESLTKTKQAKE